MLTTLHSELEMCTPTQIHTVTLSRLDVCYSFLIDFPVYFAGVPNPPTLTKKK